MYRVIEVAKILGVSKVTIYKKIEQHKRELKPFIKRRSNITYLEDGALKVLKESIQGVNTKFTEIDCKHCENGNSANETQEVSQKYISLYEVHCTEMNQAIETLNHQIKLKKEEIERKENQLNLLKKLANKIHS